MKPPVSLIVFDIAGTTVRDNGEITWAFKKAMRAFGYKIPEEEINPLMGYEKGEAIRKMLYVHEKDTAIITPYFIQNIHTRFIQEMVLYYEKTTRLEPLPGAEKLFQELRYRNIKTALNTGFSKQITDVILRRLAWLPQQVDYVISSSEVAKGRPYPYMIQNLMQQAGVTDAQQVIKVGDTEVDVREGQNAGCLYSIAITTGAFSHEALEPFHPSFIIDSLAELLAIIENAGAPI